MFGLVWLRVGLAKFDLAMVGSKVNGDGLGVAGSEKRTIRKAKTAVLGSDP